MKSLNGKVVIVTGGCGLIGRAIVDELVSYGCNVVCADLNADTATGRHNVKNVVLDMSDTASVDSLIETTLDTFGRIDGLVNAAYPRTSDWGKYHFEDTPLRHWKENVDLQLNSVFYLNQQVLRVMARQKSGSVVNFGSIYGIAGNDFTIYEAYGGTSPAEYSAIKGGIVNFTRYLASYYGKDGVRVNCVCPGGIFDNQRKEFVEAYEHRCPMKRMGSPDDIAPVCAFLVADGAKYITGQIIAVDGGWTAI